MAHRIRYALKAVSWRVIASMATFIIAYLITGHISMSIMVGGVDIVLKLFLYYLHELMWDKITKKRRV